MNSVKKVFDAIVVGGGSVGLPVAYNLALKGMKVAVVDHEHSTGQGDNKKAIGGIRACHSEPVKMKVGARSLDIVKNWQSEHGDDIEFFNGGYLFTAGNSQVEKTLRALEEKHKHHNVETRYVDAKAVQELVPGINSERNQGGLYSPHDSTVSPLLLSEAYHRLCKERGVQFCFNSPIREVTVKGDRVTGVYCSLDGEYMTAPLVVDAAGKHSPRICKEWKPILRSDSHEAGITEPVQRLFDPLVVSLAPGERSANFYFHQNVHGQILFCYSPNPPILGHDSRETATFLPVVARRMIDLLPKLGKIRVRRTWRGVYPMTPDGSPYVGADPDYKGFFHATGMCGQGFMLGPALGEVLANIVTGQEGSLEKMVLQEMALDRSFEEEKNEALK